MNIQDVLEELRTLDTENPGAWPRWVRVMFSILAAVTVVAAMWFVMAKAKLEALKSAESKQTELVKQFTEKQRKVANLDAYREQLAEMERSFGTLLRQLPSSAEVPSLINDISQTRVSSGLEESLFEPQSAQTREFYAELPNKIVLVGSYHELGSFASGIGALSRIVTVDQIELIPVSRIGTSGQRSSPSAGKGRSRGAGAPPPIDANSGDLQLTAQITTYRYLDDDELAAEAAKKTPATKRRNQ